MIFIVVSTGHFDPLIEECNRLSGKFEFFGQIGSSTVSPVFPFIRTATPQEIISKMKEAEIVISHAGTGMLSMLYELKKPAVVIPKQRRYGEANDGQVELAKKWQELGIAKLCLDVSELETKILEVRSTHPTFPEFAPLGATIRQTL